MAFAARNPVRQRSSDCCLFPYVIDSKEKLSSELFNLDSELCQKKWSPYELLKYPRRAVCLCFFTRHSGRAETYGCLLSSTAIGGLTSTDRPGILL